MLSNNIEGAVHTLRENGDNLQLLSFRFRIIADDNTNRAMRVGGQQQLMQIQQNAKAHAATAFAFFCSSRSSRSSSVVENAACLAGSYDYYPTDRAPGLVSVAVIWYDKERSRLAPVICTAGYPATRLDQPFIRDSKESVT